MNGEAGEIPADCSFANTAAPMLLPSPLQLYGGYAKVHIRGSWVTVTRKL